jgi:hypothetical protein
MGNETQPVAYHIKSTLVITYRIITKLRWCKLLALQIKSVHVLQLIFVVRTFGCSVHRILTMTISMASWRHVFRYKNTSLMSFGTLNHPKATLKDIKRKQLIDLCIVFSKQLYTTTHQLLKRNINFLFYLTILMKSLVHHNLHAVYKINTYDHISDFDDISKHIFCSAQNSFWHLRNQKLWPQLRHTYNNK